VENWLWKGLWACREADCGGIENSVLPYNAALFDSNSQFRETAFFRRPGRTAENCALMGHYAASNGNSLPTFRDSLSVPSSGLRPFFLTLKMGLKTELKSAVLSYFVAEA